jgi:ABC-type branched-subunit amino acid transport system substrate-binding protein
MVRTRLGALVGLFVLTLACDPGQDRDEGASEHAAGPGVGADSIRLGVLTDESGPSNLFALARLRAARVFFQALNDDGGINGRRVELVVADHQSKRELAVQQYAAMKDSILMVEQVYPLGFLEKDLVRDGVVASSVARYARLAGKRLVVMTGASYRMEMSNAVDWLAATLPDPKGTRIAALTQADEYGADGLAGIEEAATAHGFDLAARLTYQPTATDFSPHAAALKASGAEYVFMATQSRFTGRIVERCADIGFLPTFIGNYFAFKPEVLAELPALKAVFQKHWKTSGPFARWGEDVPGMKRLLEAVGRYAPAQQPDPFFVQGWIQAEIVAEILKRADAANDLTRPGIIKALESMREFDPGGLSAPLSYGLGEPPTRHTRMFDTVVGDARFPDMLKPITAFSAGRSPVVPAEGTATSR